MRRQLLTMVWIGVFLSVLTVGSLAATGNDEPQPTGPSTTTMGPGTYGPMGRGMYGPMGP